MAFLDNSGDIILDAVLTDTGRLRLAQGDGSFKISKFALADDEINYGLYDSAHSSGSAYYDLEVLQTPILEAFTNNTSNLKTKLVTFSRTNILYMPILALNKNAGDKTRNNIINQHGSSKSFRRRSKELSSGGSTYTTLDGIDTDRFYVAVDAATYNILYFSRDHDSIADNYYSTEVHGTDTAGTVGILEGCIKGYGKGQTQLSSKMSHFIRIDQGLETSEISPSVGLDQDLLETAYIVEMDYRLGRLKRNAADMTQAVNFIDDDNIASYYVSANGDFVNPGNISPPHNATVMVGGSESALLADLAPFDPQVFEGPRGTTLGFRIQASLELQSSTYLFEQLGTSETISGGSTILGLGSWDPATEGKTAYYIDTTVRVVGANTGYILDVPIRYVKIK